MQTLNTILNIVLIVLSIAMIAVVLMQQSKSAGLGSAFGGGAGGFAPEAKALGCDLYKGENEKQFGT